MKQNKKTMLETIEKMFEDQEIEEFRPYELVHIEMVKEGKEKYLRLYVDKEEGISHEDCTLISRKIGDFLDREDLIQEAYILEVSSPGIERPLKKLKDYERFVGRQAELKFYAPLEDLGKKTLIAIIDSVEGEMIGLKLEDTDEIVFVPFEKIAASKLVYNFD